MVVHLVLTKALLGLSVPTTPPGSKAAVATAGSAKKGRVVPTAVSDATRPAVTTVASWYDAGVRLTPEVSSWYDAGMRLTPDTAEDVEDAPAAAEQSESMVMNQKLLDAKDTEAVLELVGSEMNAVNVATAEGAPKLKSRFFLRATSTVELPDDDSPSVP